MIFRQLLDPATSTLTYLLGDEKSREAILIDCVFEWHQRDLALSRELGLKLKYALETHVHADHVTGAWLMKRAVGASIGMSRGSGARGMDLELSAGSRVRVEGIELEVRPTPGHTSSCLSYVLSDRSMAFTGDALLIRGAGRTDFQQGNAAELFRSVRGQLFSLPDACLLYPAHDYSGRLVTTVGEERRHNPRLGDGVAEQDFVGYMQNLGLPHPRRMADAVPANLECGRPAPETMHGGVPDWGPVVRTYAGVWQIEPEWVFEHLSDLNVVDVRETAEVDASLLGSIPGCAFLPLSQLRERVAEVPRGKPVVFACPGGARSAIAATIFEQAGGEAVANLRGGIRKWLELGMPLEPGLAQSPDTPRPAQPI